MLFCTIIHFVSLPGESITGIILGADLPEGVDNYSQAYIPHIDIKYGKLISLNVQAIKNENKP